MTFLEAAIEVLRDASEPLHYSAIAKEAVSRRLLSHVGRDPEAAMQKCLTSAVKAGDEALLERAKPAHYKIRPGAALPERPEPAPAPAPAPAKKASKKKATRKKVSRATSDSAASTDAPTAAAREPSAPSRVEFEAPEGAGVDGVADVAVVMASVTRQLAEADPALQRAFEASQSAPGDGPTVVHKVKGRIRSDKADRNARGNEGEERGGSKRRRRRRRKSRKAEWSAAGAEGATERGGDGLLTRAAAVLEGAGARAMHVRQLAESLAKQGVLGGDISEIERTVTAEILSDVSTHGDNSRFVACGDARYEARGARGPEAAWAAEKALRAAVAELERQTEVHLRAWLGGLGARGLEAVVRMYLNAEGYRVRSTMPPARGVCRLVAEDVQQDEDRVLVVAVPRKSSIDLRLCETEAERASCSSVLAFVMGEEDMDVDAEVRTVGVDELAEWLTAQGVGVQPLTLTVPVLDARVIESIRGLDT